MAVFLRSKATPEAARLLPESAGSHQIAVKKKGFTYWTKTLNVTGGTIHLNAELEQGAGKVVKPV